MTNIVEQVTFEANRISDRGGLLEGSVALAVLYAETLEALLMRIMQMEEHMDKNTYAFLMAPIKGRTDG